MAATAAVGKLPDQMLWGNSSQWGSTNGSSCGSPPPVPRASIAFVLQEWSVKEELQ